MSASHLLKLIDQPSALSRDALATALETAPLQLEDWLLALRSDGFTIVETDGVLFLSEPVEWLQPQRISGSTDVALEVVVETPSTNDELLQRAQETSIHRTAVLAECQTAGRGRLGRRWVSPVARNVYLSIGWQYAIGVEALQGLSLAVGAAIADALEHRFGAALELKWPNDLYINGAKCGGVLIDVTGDLANACTVVVGVGLNLQMPTGAAEQIDQAWSSIDSVVKGSFARNDVAATMLEALVAVLRDYPATGFSAWRERWQQRDLFKGQFVAVSGTAGGHGIALGVSDTGALLLDDKGVVRVINGGDASLRPQRKAT